MDKQLEKYKGFEIIPHSDGFQISPGTIRRIASFIVRRDNVISGFAFAEEMPIRMSHPEIKDEDLLQEADQIIKTHIDNDQVKHLEGYTFEFHPTNFIDVDNPQWWNKTLKELYG